MMKEDKKRQKEKFTAMSREEKIPYIWNYYKWTIIAAFALFIGLIYIIATPRDPKTEISVNVTFIGDWVNQEGVDDFALQLSNALPGLNSENQKIDFQTFSLGESADPMTVMGNMQKLAANIMSSEIDVVVGDENQLRKYASGEAFLSLSELYSKEELTGMDIVSYTYEPVQEEGSKETPYPVEYINLSDKKVLQVMIPYEKIGMTLMANSLNTEEARQVMDYLLSLD